MASFVYKSLPVEERKLAIYQACVGEAMRILQAEEKEPGSQFPRTKSLCTDTVDQCLSESDTALAQASGDLGAIAPVTQGSVQNSKKSNKAPTKNGLFYIPPVDAISPKRFARRRKHQFRLVSRSP